MGQAFWEIRWFEGMDQAEAENLKWFAHLELGKKYFEQNKLKEARAHFKLALEVAINSQDKVAMGETYLSLAKLNEAEGRDPMNYVVNALVLGKETSSAELLARTYHQFGDLHKQPSPGKALEDYRLASAIYGSLGCFEQQEKLRTSIKSIELVGRGAREKDLTGFVNSAKKVSESLAFPRVYKLKEKKYYEQELLLLLSLLKLHLNISYRGLENLLNQSKELRALIGTEEVPDHNTLQRASKRFGEDYLKELLRVIYNPK
jgi:tetratricopeptide (TPR) repeat protein